MIKNRGSMELNEIQLGNTKIVEVVSVDQVIFELGDAIDLLGNTDYLGASAIIIKSNNLPDKFFDLSSGFAGEVLQKCVNYRKKIAIVGDFKQVESKALKSFIIECNRGNQIFFCKSKEDALSFLK